MASDGHGPARPAGGADAAADALTGRLLDGRYRIGARVARGGMASVYEATDLRLDRTVAVKVMHPGLGDDEEFAARFVARGAGGGAAVAPQRGRGLRPGPRRRASSSSPWSWSPATPCATPSARRARCRPARALALLEPVLSALAAAHRAGLVHRDVKPENVLIADDGRVKVADFGLAKARQRRHPAHRHRRRADRHRLLPRPRAGRRRPRRRRAPTCTPPGVLLYELLTGRQAARGRVADPGRLQARPRRRAAPDARSRPACRRTSTRWSPAPPPATAEPAARRRGGAAAPRAPRQPGARPPAYARTTS